MAAESTISDAARNAATDAITALLNGGSVELYDGTRPAGPGTAVTTQTKIVTMTLSNPAFGAAVAGAAAINGVTEGAAVASGTPTWARWKSSGGVAVRDCNVGTSDADLIVGASPIPAGALVDITGYTLTHPA